MEEASLDAVLGDDGDAATSAGTAVAVDGQRHALLDLGRFRGFVKIKIYTKNVISGGLKLV